MAGPTRADTFRVTLTIDGVNWGVWDRKSGGKFGSDGIVYKPGGMAPQVSLGGTPSIDTITVSRLYRQERDHDHLQTLFNKVGKGRCVVKQLPLDLDGNGYGRPIVWNGTLASVTPPDHDSGSSDPAMLELEITPDGNPTA